MKLRSIALVIAVALALPACEGLMAKDTKVAQGQLYESGEAKYDGYFKKVHDEQLAAATWGDDSKTARKPLTSALSLPPNASNSTIVSAAKAKKGDSAMQAAAEDTASAELAFAKKQSENAERLQKLADDGAELKKQAVEERHNMGAEKADPQKVDKKEELKRELTAAVEVAGDLHRDASRGAKEADELVQALRKELGIVGEGRPLAKKDEPAKPEEPAKKPDAKPNGKPAATGGKKPAGKPAAAAASSEKTDKSEKAEKPAAPKPAPTQKPSDEVFNP